MPGRSRLGPSRRPRSNGCPRASASDHQLPEAGKQVSRVVWTGRGLRVVLDGEGPYVEAPQALERAVVQVPVRQRGAARLGFDQCGRPRWSCDGSPAARIAREAVIVARDLDPAGVEILHRLIDAAMPEAKLVRPTSQRQGEQLMAEADPEQR